MNLNIELTKNTRLNNLLRSDPELLDFIKWLAWVNVGLAFKTSVIAPQKIITGEISDNWVEYEAGLKETCIFNPYLKNDLK